MGYQAKEGRRRNEKFVERKNNEGMRCRYYVSIIMSRDMDLHYMWMLGLSRLFLKKKYSLFARLLVSALAHAPPGVTGSRPRPDIWCRRDTPRS